MSAKHKKNYYQILGVEPSVSAADIKKAYRKLVKTAHPDVSHNGTDPSGKVKATEDMMRLNEAYETLKDRGKRARYDVTIGLTLRTQRFIYDASFAQEDAARELYLRQVFNPARLSIAKILNMYKEQLRALSLDIYDEELLAVFESYVDELEDALRLGSQLLSSQQTPRSLDSAVRMMRYSIAQAADGLEELRGFTANFDYNHLTMAESLFRIAMDLSRQSLRLSKT